jgi:hypothetical protein
LKRSKMVVARRSETVIFVCSGMSDLQSVVLRQPELSAVASGQALHPAVNDNDESMYQPREKIEYSSNRFGSPSYLFQRLGSLLEQTWDRMEPKARNRSGTQGHRSACTTLLQDTHYFQSGAVSDRGEYSASNPGKRMTCIDLQYNSKV